MKALCFVLMPFGQKQDTGGKIIDFDAVYRELISPAIVDAGLEAIRADEERVGGIIHKPMFERLILCEFAVADLTTANANVFYELGVRHAVRPASTVLLFSGNSRLPFDVDLLRALPYWLTSAGLPDRIAETKQAESILDELIRKRGPSSETYGILGRVYKDRWEAAAKDGQAVVARTWLDKAIAAYTHGFEADWRDAYPGINAVTLMTVREEVDPRRDLLLPVVRYAAERRIAGGRADYWDRATLLETFILLRQSPKAESALGEARTIVRESWEPDTTANNLRLIREAREKRGTMEQWMKDIEDALAGEGARRREDH